jgi:hypothetical protein
MKYFTPDLFVRFQSLEADSVSDGMDAWEEAIQHYREQLHSLLPLAPEGVRRLHDHYYLHDAEVLTLGQEGPLFILVLRLDPPYRDLVLTYTLTDEPAIDRAALPAEHSSKQIEWLYDELALVSAVPAVCDHSILLSNGWELRLRFTDLQVTPFRSLVLTESQQRRADESERLGALLEQEEPSPASPR